MADGEIRLVLDAQTARQLADAAEAAGRPVETFVADLVAEHLRFSEAHEAIDAYRRDGVGAPASTVMAAFVERVSRRTKAG